MEPISRLKPARPVSKLDGTRGCTFKTGYQAPVTCDPPSPAGCLVSSFEDLAMSQQLCDICHTVQEIGHRAGDDCKVFCGPCGKALVDREAELSGRPSWCKTPPAGGGWIEWPQPKQEGHWARAFIELSARGSMAQASPKVAPVPDEEARLVAILTRPADKSYCMCNIPRERCDYHRGDGGHWVFEGDV